MKLPKKLKQNRDAASDTFWRKNEGEEPFESGSQFCWDAVAPMLQKYEEALNYHKWHADNCESMFRDRRAVNEKELCDCGAYQAKEALETVRTELGE